MSVRISIAESQVTPLQYQLILGIEELKFDTYSIIAPSVDFTTAYKQLEMQNCKDREERTCESYGMRIASFDLTHIQSQIVKEGD